MNNELSDNMLESVVGGTKEVFTDVRNFLYSEYNEQIDRIKSYNVKPSTAAEDYKRNCENYRDDKGTGLEGNERNEIDRIIRVNYLRVRNWTSD